MACPPDDFARLLDHLARLAPGAQWDVVVFYPPPIDVPPEFHVRVARRAIATALSVGWRAIARRYGSAVICCHDRNQQGGLPALMEFVSLLPARSRFLMDRDGRQEPITGRALKTLATGAGVAVLLPLSILVTRVGLKLWKSDALPRPQANTRGHVAILVPIAPDLSHTFVYREVLALKAAHPDWLILSLERGDATVVHHEASEVLRLGEFVPHLAPMPYLWRYLRAWWRSPSAMAATIRFISPHTAAFGPGAIANDDLAFVRLQYIHHSNHVMLGFVLAEFLRSRDVGYVHVYGSTFPAVRMVVAHRLLGIPYSISTYVDFEYVTPFHMLSEKFEPARFAVTCTAFCASRLGALVPSASPRLCVLHHALPANYVEGKRLRPADGRSRLVYIGRFVEKKGLDTLIRACALLRDRQVEVTCHLYGAGPEHERLDALRAQLRLNDRVSFEGPIPNERFYETMNHDDIFVCPCRYVSDGERDGIPVSMMEAMAAGMTVLSTPVSGIPELIDDGVNAYLVPPDDEHALANRIEAILSHPASRQTISDAAVRTIRERFSLERSAPRLDAWISEQL